MQYCVYAHALSCTEHMSRKRIWSLKWQTKTKKKKLAIYRAWPWISNCWEWDSNSGLSGIESSALTTRPSRLGANLRRDATSRLLFLDQSVLADFDPRKKKEPHFKTRSLSGTSNNNKNYNNKELYNNSNNNHYNHDNNNTSIFEVVSDFVTENTTSTTKVFGELHSMYFFPEEFNSHTRESQEPCF